MKRFILTLFIFISTVSFAREGMWLPQLLQKLNEKDMKSLGMKISAEDIYSVTHSSLKDAIVQFGGGCTGELISGQGLLLTNHHCGFSQIQSLSSIEKNYLRDGHWAMTPEEELPCPGLNVTFVISIRDVTASILESLDDTLSEEQRDTKIKQLSDSIEQQAVSGTPYKASVKSFYHTNEYYLIVTEVFRDIRYVGSPPVSIGNFGGETDNWEWPRHTGDFSLFRIYAGKDNSPAEFSEDNIPYKPKKYFTISIAGIKENDFAMVMGFPGRSNEYLSTPGVEMVYSQTNPDKIRIREIKLGIWEKAMKQNDTIRLHYSQKFRTIANYYKKWKGESAGILKNDVLAKKKEFEVSFVSWMNDDPERLKKYEDLPGDFEDTYRAGKPFSFANDFFTESLQGIELVNIASRFIPLIDLFNKKDINEKLLHESALKIKADLETFYRNYHAALDEKVCAGMLRLSSEQLPDSFQPGKLKEIRKKYKDNFEKYAAFLYGKSFLASKDITLAFLENFNSNSVKKITADPAFELSVSITGMLKEKITPGYTAFQKQVGRLQRIYMKGILEMEKGKKIFPDANSTLRVSYGKVEGMTPRDGMIYNYFTTIDGIMNKSDSTSTDFRIPDRLAELYRKKDYGRYASRGTIPVDFLSSCQTTGGNSGSPVINAKGELIGTNFDRTLEGVMSDYYYEGELGRNISVDIRYTLFIIEKFAGDQRLIDEMKISSK